MVSPRGSLQIKRHTEIESKGMKMEATTIKKTWVAILISDKTDFETKAIIRDKEGPSNFTSGY